MFATRRGKRVAGFTAIAFVLVLVSSAGLWWVFRDLGAKQFTAYFNETVGVYPGSDLRILGVSVGSIDSVLPEGNQVQVVMTLDDDIQVPANADAVVVSPSLVSDRYIQLSPVYNGGPTMANDAVIPANRTATPVELDQLYNSLNQLATALGPNGANANGALSNLLNTGAANLAGNGQALGTMIQQLGAATRTLSGSQDNLFDTINNLQQFTTMLKDNNSQVQTVTNQLASVSGFLADDRQNLGAALNELATALGQVQSFISNNRDLIQSNVDKLESISQILVNQRASLAEALNDLPLGLDNLLGAYDPAHQSLDGRGDLAELLPEQNSGPAGGPAKPNTQQAASCPGAVPALAAICQSSSGAPNAGPALPLPSVGQTYTSTSGGGQ